MSNFLFRKSDGLEVQVNHTTYCPNIHWQEVILENAGGKEIFLLVFEGKLSVMNVINITVNKAVMIFVQSGTSLKKSEILYTNYYEQLFSMNKSKTSAGAARSMKFTWILSTPLDFSSFVLLRLISVAPSMQFTYGQLSRQS